MSRGALAFLAAAMILAVSAVAAGGEQVARYRGGGDASRLFDQFDNDGYSLAVTAGAGGSVELTVRVSDSPLASRAPFPTGLPRDRALPSAPERDAFSQSSARGATTEAAAVERILGALAAAVRYDPDHVRRQDPSAVFAEKRANCVGLSELAVDLLRRAGIRARTVQGVLNTEPGTAGYEPRIGGAYHRWIEVHYPDRGFAFSDPSASVNGVDARYLPFARRAYSRPTDLRLTPISFAGTLGYETLPSGVVSLRRRATR
ncbi:MAG: transglutaminase-like domain-containing protein, partial [Acidobacteriota bacterium]